MEKVKLNISGSLVGIEIPSTIAFEGIEEQLKSILIKNHKLLRTLKFYKLIKPNFDIEEILKVKKIIESIIGLKPLEKIKEYKGIKERKIECRFHYGSLRSGEKLESESSIVIIGNLNPGSYVKSKKNIFVYGKAYGTLHAGCQINKYQSSFIYIEGGECLDIRIGETQFIYEHNEINKNLIFEKKAGKIIEKKIDKNQIKELIKRMGLDLM
uniref:Septum formation inhibitor MinC C-terminal domain-containing protein n=1 Tax=Hirondellea gigas TaxID=1518452 RepID=A0A6A7G9J4_9CRUS